MKLGTSQKAVFDFLVRVNHQPTTQEVGDKLYEKTSECFLEHNSYWNTGKSGPSQVRKHWAFGLLNELKKKGLAGYNKEKMWYLTEKGWTLGGENK